MEIALSMWRHPGETSTLPWRGKAFPIVMKLSGDWLGIVEVIFSRDAIVNTALGNALDTQNTGWGYTYIAEKTAWPMTSNSLLVFFSAISSTGKSTELLPLWFGVRILDGGPEIYFINDLVFLTPTLSPLPYNQILTRRRRQWKKVSTRYSTTA